MIDRRKTLRDLHALGYSIASLARWADLHPETLRRNIAHRRSGRPGLRVAGLRLTEAIVIELRARAAAGENVAALASEIGVDRTTVYCAVIGRSWGHLPGAIAPSRHGGRRKNAGRKRQA